MTDLGRPEPFVAATQSNAFAMPAKGNLRPETVIGRCLAQCPLTDQKVDIHRRTQKPVYITEIRYVVLTR